MKSQHMRVELMQKHIVLASTTTRFGKELTQVWTGSWVLEGLWMRSGQLFSGDLKESMVFVNIFNTSSQRKA